MVHRAGSKSTSYKQPPGLPEESAPTIHGSSYRNVESIACLSHRDWIEPENLVSDGVLQKLGRLVRCGASANRKIRTPRPDMLGPAERSKVQSYRFSNRTEPASYVEKRFNAIPASKVRT